MVHGGLDYARFPLLVGHHMNEAISGAGRRVDVKLGGQLQCLIDLKLFVGALRTAQYLRPNNHEAAAPPYPGAIALGLGAIGELTPATLAETVTRGVLRYAFEHVHRDPFAAPLDQPCELRLSSVLLGTQLQALTTSDAVSALLQGVWRAARLIANINKAGRRVRLAELEIIEIDESTAIDASYELRRLLSRSEWRPRYTWADSELLETREGATSGYRRHVGNSTWQRLIVRHDEDGGLSFALIGEQARVEATRVQADVASLRRFIDRVSDGGGAPDDAIRRGTDPLLGAVLYQLLLPHTLRSRMSSLDNTVLVVDDAAAAYPWELLTPPAELSDDGIAPRPIAVQAGFVRQRITSEFRQLPQLHTGRRALLIGAPFTGGWFDEFGNKLPFNDLQGARDEALAVRTLLQDTGRWEVDAWISPKPNAQPAGSPHRQASFEQVRVALLKEPCRILHLCGHGVVDQWIRRSGVGTVARDLRKSGVVLSSQELLGAVDAESMSFTPEFVFLNCCYSGREGEGRVSGQGPRAALASSLALKFIDMGSRAVIATGWQIDDQAALLFATAFYTEMLDGKPFGEAVRTAREKVYEQHGEQNNTWGAFQCYGDPHWRLESGARAGDDDTACLRNAHHTVSPGELASRLAQVQAIAGTENAMDIKGQLDDLIDRLAADPQRRAWLHDSRVLADTGLAYREIGEYETAALYLQRAGRGIGSQMRIGDIDTLVDALLRVPTQPSPQQPHVRAVEELLTQLDQLGGSAEGRWPQGPQQPDDAPSCLSERQSLRGALALRVAHAHAEADPGVSVAALGRAAHAYAAAYRIKLAERDMPERCAHVLSGALLAAALLALLHGAAGLEAAGAALQPMANGDQQGLLQASDWRKAAQDLLDTPELQGDRNASFGRHATGIQLRTASGLFAHALRDTGYDAVQVARDMDLVRRDMARLLNLWPSPVRLESLRFRFRLIECIVRGPGRYHEGADVIGGIAHDALDLLDPSRRAES